LKDAQNVLPPIMKMIFYQFNQLSNHKGDGPMYKHMIAWEPTNSTGNALQGVINFIGAYIWGSTATRKFTQKKRIYQRA
jgi:hypothetical protein